MQSQFSAKSQGSWPRLLASYSINYLVVAGGGGGNGNRGGGGGAGGYRASGYGPSPLQAPALTLEEGDYAIVVGAGGASSDKGTNSTFSTITSTGGGAANDFNSPACSASSVGS
jgi:hypothetical protein